MLAKWQLPCLQRRGAMGAALHPLIQSLHLSSFPLDHLCLVPPPSAARPSLMTFVMLGKAKWDTLRPRLVHAFGPPIPRVFPHISFSLSHTNMQLAHPLCSATWTCPLGCCSCHSLRAMPPRILCTYPKWQAHKREICNIFWTGRWEELVILHTTVIRGSFWRSWFLSKCAMCQN